MAPEFNPDLLDLSVVSPDGLTARGLAGYVRLLEENDLDAYTYRVAFWVRIATVISILVLTVLAVPFVFGPLRSAGAGGRLLVGVMIGVAFVLASKTLQNSGEVYGLDPLLIGWAPTGVVGIATLVAFLRTR